MIDTCSSQSSTPHCSPPTTTGTILSCFIMAARSPFLASYWLPDSAPSLYTMLLLQCYSFYLENGGSKVLQNTGMLPHHYITSQPRRIWPEYTWSVENQIFFSWMYQFQHMLDTQPQSTGHIKLWCAYQNLPHQLSVHW